MSAPLSIGLFVGGAGSRMGGVAKGLLRAPEGDETLIERLLRLCLGTVPNASLFLVGQSGPYAGLGLPTLSDDPVQVGPIGGMRSLLRQARALQSPAALALACDLPFLDEAILKQLTAPLRGAARVPFCEGSWQPLAAAYEPRLALEAVERALSSRKYALMQVLDQLGSGIERLELESSEAAALRDWDTPEDVQHH